MKKRYRVMIDDTVLSQSFTLDELLAAGLLDDYDVNIKIRATSETIWQVAREYPFYQSESIPTNSNYVVNEDGSVTRKKRGSSNNGSSSSATPRGHRIDEYGQVVRNSKASRLELSIDSLHFTSSCGSRSITITAGGEWNISLNAASWIHLSKSGSNLTVNVDQNYSSNSRTDYVRLKSGNIEKEINIYQSGNSSGSSTTSSSSNDNNGCAWPLWIAIGIGILAAIFS